VDRGVNGLRLHGCRYGELSEQLQFEQEQAVALEVERYYKKAKEILALNTEFLEKVAQALAEKKLLTTMDIQKIKNSSIVNSQCTKLFFLCNSTVVINTFMNHF
jgi:ATP-dependent Zn protease